MVRRTRFWRKAVTLILAVTLATIVSSPTGEASAATSVPCWWCANTYVWDYPYYVGPGHYFLSGDQCGEMMEEPEGGGTEEGPDDGNEGEESYDCTYDEPGRYHFWEMMTIGNNGRRGNCWDSNNHQQCWEYEEFPVQLSALLRTADSENEKRLARKFLALGDHKNLTINTERSAIQASDCLGNVVLHLPVTARFSELLAALDDQNN